MIATLYLGSMKWCISGKWFDDAQGKVYLRIVCGNSWKHVKSVGYPALEVYQYVGVQS